MPVESVTTIADLNPSWPLGSDQKQFGDDHIRNIKTALKALSSEMTVLPKADGSATGELRLFELAVNGVNYVGFRVAPALGSSLMWTLPTAGGAPGSVLTNAGDGTLSWAAGGGGAGVYPTGVLTESFFLRPSSNVVNAARNMDFYNPPGRGKTLTLLRLTCWSDSPPMPVEVRTHVPGGLPNNILASFNLGPGTWPPQVQTIPSDRNQFPPDSFVSYATYNGPGAPSNSGGTGQNEVVITLEYQINP